MKKSITHGKTLIKHKRRKTVCRLLQRPTKARNYAILRARAKTECRRQKIKDLNEQLDKLEELRKMTKH